MIHLRFWGKRFIKSKRLRKKLNMSITEYRKFLFSLKQQNIIKTHFSGFGPESHIEGRYSGHEKVITVLDKERFLSLCEKVNKHSWLPLFESIRIFISLILFGYCAFTDFKYREINNRVWIYFTPIGITLTLLSIAMEQLSFLNVLLSITVSSVFALVLWFLGGFGGADAKALITLALLLPLGFSTTTPYFPLVSLAFGCLTAMPYIIYKLHTTRNFKNLELPLLPFLFAGIIVSLFIGEWFTQLIC